MKPRISEQRTTYKNKNLQTARARSSQRFGLSPMGDGRHCRVTAHDNEAAEMELLGKSSQRATTLLPTSANPHKAAFCRAAHPTHPGTPQQQYSAEPHRRLALRYPSHITHHSHHPLVSPHRAPTPEMAGRRASCLCWVLRLFLLLHKRPVHTRAKSRNAPHARSRFGGVGHVVAAVRKTTSVFGLRPAVAQQKSSKSKSGN